MHTTAASFPTPQQIVKHLDRFVHGQRTAKCALAAAVYEHYLGMAYREREHQLRLPFGAKHVLMIGPTGCGKTYLVNTLARYLEVPFSFTSATGLTEAGYTGDNVDSMFDSLMAQTKGDVRKAERGIIFVDEIDKIRRQDCGRDVSGEGVQAAMLPLLDGSPFVFRTRERAYEFDASRILFICAGAFVGLAEIVRDRLQDGCRFGFRAHDRNHEEASDDDRLSRVEAADLERFGFIPELIGRFASVIGLRTLAAADLVSILTDTEDSALSKQTRLFAQHGIELQVTPGALEEIAVRSIRSRTNARGAERMLIEATRPLNWQLPELAARGVRQAIIDEAVVRGESEPILKNGAPMDPRAELPASKLRRDASALLKTGRLPGPEATRTRTRRRSRPHDDAGQMRLPF